MILVDRLSLDLLLSTSFISLIYSFDQFSMSWLLNGVLRDGDTLINLSRLVKY